MRAISSMATRGVLSALADAAADAGLGSLEIESVGGVDAADRVAAGESFDLVFLASGSLARLAEAGALDAATVTPLLLSQTAAAVPGRGVTSAAAPVGPDGEVETAFASAAETREALRSAARIGYSTGPSGTALVRLVEEWGLSSELADRLVRAKPGIPVARSLAEGDVDLGFQQLSELVGADGVRILGVLPEDCAIDTVFGGAVASTATDPAAAADVLALFARAAAEGIAGAHSFRAV